MKREKGWWEISLKATRKPAPNIFKNDCFLLVIDAPVGTLASQRRHSLLYDNNQDDERYADIKTFALFPPIFLGISIRDQAMQYFTGPPWRK